MKPDPVTVRVRAGAPALAELGEIEEIAGITGLMVEVRELVFNGGPGVGPGLETKTLTVPGAINLPEFTLAVSWVLETKVVINGLPPHCTIEFWTKPVPVRVMVNVGSPTFADDGEMLVSVGVAGLIVSATAFDAGPFMLATVICAVPGWPIRFGVTCAVICVELTAVEFNCMLFRETVAPGRKL